MLCVNGLPACVIFVENNTIEMLFNAVEYFFFIYYCKLKINIYLCDVIKYFYG